MEAELHRYPAYKDSGVPWLGEVPEHWDLSTLRRKLSPYDGIKIGPFGSQLKLDQMTESGYKVYGQANVIAHDFNRGKKFIDHNKFSELAACDVRPGDLVVTMMGTSGRCARVPDHAVPGIMDSHLLRLRTSGDTDVRFAAKIIDEAPYVKEQIVVAGKGSIMHGLNSSMIKDLIVALPPVSEQAAIVRFLDHVDRRIRCYIRAKQKLIKLLEEQKQVIIQQAVTRGVNANVRLKPSGVVGVGDIPAHWEVKRGKFFFKEIDVRSTSGDEELLSVSHLTGVTPRSQKSVNMFKAESYVGSKVCLPGQVAVNTMWTWMAAIGVSRYHGIVSPSYHTYQRICADTFSDEYLDLLLRTPCYKTLYLLNSSGITTSRLRLYPEDFLNIKFIRPPLDEQEEIVAWVNRNCSTQQTGTESTQREIDLLREYRTRLISDVVTGKLDVREAAAQFPDETHEPEPTDQIEADDDVDADAADEIDAVPEEAEA
jgi:type I restriction enzyme S subunit